MSDFILSRHGDVWLLIPCTPAAERLCAHQLSGHAQPPWGGALCIPERHIEAIALGIHADGFTIEHRMVS